MRVLRALVKAAVIGGVGTLAVALVLVATDPAQTDPRAPSGGGLVFDGRSQAEVAPLRGYPARDGTRLGYRRWDSGDGAAPLVVAVHGSGFHSAQFAALGAALAGAGLADVVAPDLRGHGPAPARRGDVDYIGQMEDDLADLIAHAARPGQAVVMLGHSAGGGLVIRFAGGTQGRDLAGAVLLAPFLQHDAPTARPDTGGWALVRLRRIIGLTILNAAGITGLNHLTVLQFRFPDAVLDGPAGGNVTRGYSFRLMTGYNPRRDWQGDVSRLPPFLLVAGLDDEAFAATAYEGALAPGNPGGRYVLLPGVGHLDVVDDAATLDAIGSYLSAIPR